MVGWRALFSGAGAIFVIALALACNESSPGAVAGSRLTAEGTDRGARGDTVLTQDVVVVVHSYTGKTARAGAEIARIFGAALYRRGEGPISIPVPGPDPAELRAAVSRARLVFLGYPIWNAAPSFWAQELARELPLEGKKVVLFETFIHASRDEERQKLQDDIERRGGTVVAVLPFLWPQNATPERRDDDVRRAILSRPHLWREEEPAPKPDCSAEGAPEGHVLCRVPAGHAWLGSGPDGVDPGSPPPRWRRVPAFAIDRHEVTNAQFARCVQDGACRGLLNPFPCIGFEDEPRPDWPLFCVDPATARAYCRWAGLRLVREAEWYRAARGDTLAPYPWGDASPVAGPQPRGNFGQKVGKGLELYETVSADAEWIEDGVPFLAKVCSFPAGDSPFGVCDLAGNIAELIEPEGSPETPDAPAYLAGGSWIEAEPRYLNVGATAPLPRPAGFYLTGFRCARDL